MTLQILAWLVAIPVLGFMTGARTMMPMAICCLFAYRHHLWLYDTWAFWMMKPITFYVFVACAVGEVIGDKLPMTPNRTAPALLISRVAFGGLVGALAATGLEGSAPEGIFLGAVSALLGTFLTYHLRHWLTHQQGIKDLWVAIAEDCIVLGSSILALGIITG
jgi:uncharacterized membrane protein